MKMFLSCATVVVLLHLLAGYKAFNNVFLDATLFSILQPASSSKADDIDELLGESQGASNETELWHSNSVFVDAPP